MKTSAAPPGPALAQTIHQLCQQEADRQLLEVCLLIGVNAWLEQLLAAAIFADLRKWNGSEWKLRGKVG